MVFSTEGKVNYTETMEGGCEDMFSINDSPESTLKRMISYLVGMYPVEGCPMKQVSDIVNYFPTARLSHR